MGIKNILTSKIFLIGTTGIVVSAAAISAATVLIVSKGSSSYEITQANALSGHKKWVDETKKDLDRKMIATAASNKNLFSLESGFLNANNVMVNPSGTLNSNKAKGYATSISELVRTLGLSTVNSGYVFLNNYEYVSDIFNPPSNVTSPKKYANGVQNYLQNKNNYDTMKIDGKNYTYYKTENKLLNKPDFFPDSDLITINSQAAAPSKQLPSSLYAWGDKYYSNEDGAYEAMFEVVNKVISDWGPVKKEQKTLSQAANKVVYNISLKNFNAEFRTNWIDPTKDNFEVKASDLSNDFSIQKVSLATNGTATKEGESYTYNIDLGDGTNPPILSDLIFEIPTFGKVPKWTANNTIPLEDVYSKKSENQVIYIDGDQYTYYGAGKNNPLFSPGVIPSSEKPFDNRSQTHSFKAQIWPKNPKTGEIDTTTSRNMQSKVYSFFYGDEDPSAGFTQESGGRTYNNEFFGYALTSGALYLDSTTNKIQSDFVIDNQHFVYHEAIDGIKAAGATFDETTKKPSANVGTNKIINEVKLFDKSQNPTVKNDGYDYFPYWENTTTHEVYLTGFSFYNRLDIKDVTPTQFLAKTYALSTGATVNRKKISEMPDIYKNANHENTFSMKNSSLYRPATSANGNWYEGELFDLKTDPNVSSQIMTNPKILDLGDLYVSKNSDQIFTNNVKDAKGYKEPVSASAGWFKSDGTRLDTSINNAISNMKYYVPNLHAYFSTKNIAKIKPIYDLDKKIVTKNDLISQGKKLVKVVDGTSTTPVDYHYVDKYLAGPLASGAGLFLSTWDGTANGITMKDVDGTPVRFDDKQTLFSATAKDGSGEVSYYTSEEKLEEHENIVKLSQQVIGHFEQNKSTKGFIMEGYSKMTDDELNIELNSLGAKSANEIADPSSRLVEETSPFNGLSVPYIYIDGKKYFSIDED